MYVSSLRSTECGAKGQGDYPFWGCILPLLARILGFLTLVDAIVTEGLKIKQRRVQTGGRGALLLMTGK